jgi:hypothetical protein
MNLRRFSQSIILIGLLSIVIACTQTPSPQMGYTPTVHAPTPLPTRTVQLTPTPTLFRGITAQLGSLPTSCPPGPTFVPTSISSQFPSMVGAGPAWAGAIHPYKQLPLALIWDSNDAMATHNQYGWGHKLLWIVATSVHGSVTIRGTNLSTGMPVYPWGEYATATSTQTTMILNPSDPSVVNEDANRDEHWTQFPGSLTVPGAGCYSLTASWPGGSWRMTFAAGLVQSYA